ncbi:mitochondrial carrier homolog 2 isoform X2 [Tribolium castaneum]|uniref:mitochondrial carrier homolog 2 isoform X2 n=1 Tax=Tribolium castaneum TaxID=7070 RepID=UPI0030FE9A2C
MKVVKDNENKWSGYGLRIFLNTLSHPFEYAKVLIQIGYEPIPPHSSKTLLGKPALKLPNIFQYVKHIKSVDGLSGCYRGLGPKVCGSLINLVATQKMMEYLDLNQQDEEEDTDVEENRKQKFLKCLKGDIITHTTAIIISQPFHVITIRIMAQFVGKEAKYVGVFGSIGEIYRQNGILGFFSGLIPRLIGDILSVLLASSLTYVVNKYLIEEKEIQNYTSAAVCNHISQMVSSSIMYPFQVVSNCMAVSNSGLLAGSPPYMLHYNTWIDCWNDLSSRNQLKRGSSLLVRYYKGPSLITSKGNLLKGN